MHADARRLESGFEFEEGRPECFERAMSEYEFILLLFDVSRDKVRMAKGHFAWGNSNVLCSRRSVEREHAVRSSPCVFLRGGAGAGEPNIGEPNIG